MDSPQSVVSPYKNSADSSEHEKQKSDFFTTRTSKDLKTNGKDSAPPHNNNNLEPSIGLLHVYIHSARDIHNICIYHKQDVYAKICLTTDPDKTVSSTIINGGGRNPVFNEKLELSVNTIESSLKCEIWMLSRVRNYLEDQLLGFALVPLSEVLINNGELEKEFSLSSTDLFHSPAGFVQLSLKYTGASPAVIASAKPAAATNLQEDGDADISESPITSELDKIEFPDPKIANEDQIMVSEYFGLPCTSLESDDTSSESLVNAGGENVVNDQHDDVVESFSNAETVQAPPKAVDSPPSVSTANGALSPSVQASSESSEAPVGEKAKSPDREQAKEKAVDGKDSESDSSGGLSSDSFTKPVVTVNIEPEQKVVQQDIVDMYMKSMQQFTESLAKMKLPLDIDPAGTTTTSTTTPTSMSSSENSSSDPKLQAAKNSGSRVFYGSRAFF